MTRRRSALLLIAAALLVAGGLGAAFWLEYAGEVRRSRQALVERGRTILAALEGGMRSHQRVGAWLRANIGAVLEETAASTGCEGLALFGPNARFTISGGTMPEGVEPAPAPQWLDGRVVVTLMTRLDAPPPGPQRAAAEGRREEIARNFLERWREQRGADAPGAQRPGFGRPGGPPGESRSDVGSLLREPVALVVVLSDAPFRAEVAAARKRLLSALAVVAAALALGVTLLATMGRQGRLAAQLDLARERSRRLEELTRLGAGLAHETKNPLSMIRGHAQAWLRAAGGENLEARAAAERVIDESDRIVGRLNAFLQFARPAEPNLKPCELKPLLEEITGLFRDEASGKSVALRCETPPVRALADVDMLRQIVVNLLTNALAACGKGDEIHVETRPGDKGRVDLRVRDSGRGMAPEDAAKAASPYFSKTPGGSGMGLAVVAQIAEAHGWRLDVESVRDVGTSVSIRGIKEA